MRILVLTCEYPPIGGGGAAAARTLAHALRARGVEIEIVTAGMADLPAESDDQGVHVHRVRGFRRTRFYSNTLEQASFVLPMWRKASAIIAERPVDLVHSHFIVPTSLIAWRLACSQAIPYVVTAHGSDVPGYNPERFALVHRMIAPLWQRIVARASAITAPSEFLVDLIFRRAEVPVEHIANPMAMVDVLEPKREKPPTILSVGRLVERKGFQYLIEALGNLRTDAKLVIAGDGPMRPQLETQARELGVECTFLGFISREEVAKAYSAASIFAMPSVQENFPMVLLEAMSNSLAVVTTDCPGCAEVVGDAALKTRAGDVASLQACLARLLNDPGEIASLGQAARRRSELFAADRIAGKFMALFERLVGRQGTLETELESARPFVTSL